MCSPEHYLSSGAKKIHSGKSWHHESPWQNWFKWKQDFHQLHCSGKKKCFKKQRNKCLVLVQMSSSEQTRLFWLKQGFLLLLHQQMWENMFLMWECFYQGLTPWLYLGVKTLLHQQIVKRLPLSMSGGLVVLCTVSAQHFAAGFQPVLLRPQHAPCAHPLPFSICLSYPEAPTKLI